MGKLIYEPVKEYDRFRLWNVFINRPENGKMRKVYLYQTTTHKVKPVLGSKSRKWNWVNPERCEEIC